MNILYIHGLNGSLSLEKKIVLEHYGDVFAPSIDYENAPNSILEIIEHYPKITFNVVIGSSMGGFASYYISNHFQCPTLLFNPALEKRSVVQNIPEITHKISPNKHIVIGTEDNVVNPKDTLQFIANIVDLQPNFKIHLRNHLAHRIPLDIFKEEVNTFFNNI
ncbi:YqiA/YcfP family alpha/beta fold hydrolase [Winogradskyella wichelsiae]|uniref:YqiA/YcfP family alpha/beta fold hydrolase n=1 Tax=Winogradskyella wichelsiae TaxID=2697007 RepID=UPI0015C93304|nr:YqiA/YcfP family alpha/beta fold hydrolase [Winogradskyella wichelsiae]